MKKGSIKAVKYLINDDQNDIEVFNPKLVLPDSCDIF